MADTQEFEIKKPDNTNPLTADEWVCTPKDDLVNCEITSDKKIKVTRKKSGVTAITLTNKTNPQKYEPLEIKITVPYKGVRVKIGDAISAFVPGSREVNLSVFEEETLNLQLVSVGQAGETAPIKETVTLSSGDGGDALEAGVKEGVLSLKAKPLSNTTPASAILDITFPKVANNVDSPTVIRLNVTVKPKFGIIELSTQGDKSFLVKNGRVTINAKVRDRRGGEIAAFVKFEIAETDKKWVSLSEESNFGKATLTWREPSAEEIRKPDGSRYERPSSIQVTATARITPQGESTDRAISGSITIRMGEVSGFALLKVKLNVMDDRTAADLYGSVAAREYYVLTVRLFNNLQEDKNGDLRGASILAYSSSIEVGVGLEKRFNGDSRSSFSRLISKEAANEIRKSESDDAESKAKQRAGDTISLRSQFSDAVGKQLVAEKAAVDAVREAIKLSNEAKVSGKRSDIQKANEAIRQANAALKTARATGLATAALREIIEKRAARSEPNLSSFPSGPNVAIDDGMWHSLTRADLEGLAPLTIEEINEAVLPETGEIPLLDESKIAGEGPRAGVNEGVIEKSPIEPTCQGVIKYRPFTFEMMVNTVDRRNERRQRTKIFNILEFVGTSTSFVTSFLVPGAGSDLPLGLEKYRNLFIPGMERIYRDYKELHRQNLVSQTMREIEEIPYGSDITRVIFIPKKDIRGIMRGHDVRISEICPYYFNIEVGVIRDKATVQQGAIR